MQYPKHELIARLGEPAEENVRPNPGEPGKPMNVLRWECGCAASKLRDEPFWEWEPCEQHEKERPVV